MKKVKDFIINNKLYFIYLGVIITILFIISMISGIYPLGDHTLIKNDFAFQYYPMMQEIYNRVYDGKSLLYSFNDGLGLPLYRNIIYYMCSPINLLFLLIKDHMLAAHLIINLKIVLIGFTMLLYLKHKFKSNDLILLIPTLCFTLCGWINAYYLNIMWLDCLIMLPLITLGIESLVNEKKYKLYIFSLAYAIISNYYIGYMLCAFSLFYFLVYNVYKIKKDGSFNYKLNELSRNLINFGIASVMAALISSIVLIPTATSLATLDEKITGYGNTYVYNAIDFLGAHLSNSVSTTLCIESAGDPMAPNIYTGVISVILLFIFIFNNKINKSTKISYIVLLLIFTIIMKVELLDYIMNVFHVPAGFPYRYSFMYSFILCIISAYSLMNIKNIKARYIIISSIGISLITLLVYLYGTNKIDNNYILLNYLFISLITICLLLKKYKISYLFLFVVICSELIMSFVTTNEFYTTKLLNSYYEKKYSDTITKPNKDEFYRSVITYNAGYQAIIDDYYGVDTSSSMSYSSIYYFAHSIGLGTDYSAYIYYTSGSYLANILYSIKDIHTYKDVRYNEDRLSLLYGIDSKQERKLDDSPNFFRSSNMIAEDLTGIKDLYTMNTYKNKKVLFEDDNFIIYKYNYPKNTVLKPNISNLAFVLSNDIYYSLYGIDIDYKLEYADENILNYPYMIDATNGEVIVGYFKTNINEEYLISFQLDSKKATEVYNYLNRYPSKIDYFNEDYIEASITLDNDMSIMSSIPYDTGWHVYVDDKEVDTYGQYNAFLGFDLSKGEHKIKLKYKTPYIKEGLLVSCISFVSVIAFDIVTKIIKKKKTTSK